MKVSGKSKGSLHQKKPKRHPKPTISKNSTTITRGLNPDAALVGVRVRFDTHGDDKDGDTALGLALRNDNNVMLAHVAGVMGYWGDPSTNFVDLFIDRQTFRNELSRPCHLEIAIQPVGRDTWGFDFTACIVFSDGTQTEVGRTNNWLNQLDWHLFFPVEIPQ